MGLGWDSHPVETGMTFSEKKREMGMTFQRVNGWQRIERDGDEDIWFPGNGRIPSRIPYYGIFPGFLWESRKKLFGK